MIICSGNLYASDESTAEVTLCKGSHIRRTDKDMLTPNRQACYALF